MEWELPANGWAPRPHVHPRLTEEYEVLDGSLDVLLGSEWRTLTARDAASVPPGTVHTFRVGAGPVRVRNVHRPALDFEPYIERLCSAANQRDLGDLSSIRALLCVAVLVREYPQHSRAPRASSERSRACAGSPRAPSRVPNNLTGCRDQPVMLARSQQPPRASRPCRYARPS